MGRLSPAGTGLPMYKKLGIKSDMEETPQTQDGRLEEIASEPLPKGKIVEKMLDKEDPS
jgi:hypothetical protein